MTPTTRLNLFLSTFLGAAVPGCAAFDRDLDDTACLYIAIDAACPSEDAAQDRLVGTTTCTSPVEEVVATGAFVSERNVVLTGYGGANPFSTGDTGAENAQHECCYEAAYRVHPDEGCVVGRPLWMDGKPVSACAVERVGWSEGATPRVDDLTDDERAALAEAWTEAGLLEHASIPAFARAALDLVALGAPNALVARTAAAMADEVTHATACFALASAYAGHPVGPSGLRTPNRRPATLVRVAVETFREGCAGETFAVALAAAQLRTATDPAVRAALATIVDDEARHAALAWDIVRWAVAAGGAPVRRAIARELARMQVPAPSAPAPTAGLRAHGVAAAELANQALAGVFAEVIAPAAAELLAA